MDIWVTLAGSIFFLFTEGFFSGSEMGIVSSDKMRLRHDAAKGSRGARLALKMLEKPEWLLSTTLVGTNISIVANSTLVTALMLELFGRLWFLQMVEAPHLERVAVTNNAPTVLVPAMRGRILDREGRIGKARPRKLWATPEGAAPD